MKDQLGRILVIDDDEANRTLLLKALDRFGYEDVVTAPGGSEGLRLVGSSQPDLVLLDIHMEGMNGLEFLSKLEDLLAEDEYLPVLVLTVDLTSEIRHLALRRGAKDFLTKPIDVTELGYRVRNFLETRRLHVELQQQKQNLEDRVKARTNDLKRANELLTNQLEQKDMFIAGVSHELRTPLTSILGLTAELSDSWDDFEEPERRDLVGDIYAQSNDMAAVIEDLLVAARLDLDNLAVAPGVIPITGEIESAVRSLQTGLAMRIEVPEVGGTVYADPLRIRQVLRNLLHNAGRHGGPQVKVESHFVDPWTEIRVSDDGDEIPADRRELIFEPYYKATIADGLAPSLGLGLFISRSLARLMDGDVEYERRAGWNVFILRLPSAPQKVGITA